MQLGIEVVIAEHPKSDYSKHPDYFQGRKRVRGDTARLVHESRFVLAHASTSIDYAVLFEKPIILLTSEVLDKTTMGCYIRGFADSLGLDVVFYDMESKDITKQIHTTDRYATFIDDYIKTKDSPRALAWEIVADVLKR
jgi:hypothetical protein